MRRVFSAIHQKLCAFFGWLLNRKDGFAIAKDIMLVLLSIAMLLIAGATLMTSKEANERAQAQFESELRPMVQDRPIKFEIIQPAVGATWRTHLDVTNYSAYDAYNVTYDVKYGANDWLVQWIIAGKAHALGKIARQEKLTDDEQGWATYQQPVIDVLPQFSRVSRDWRQAPTRDDFCVRGRDTEKVLVRTTWSNKNGHVFERVREYTLLCTVNETGRTSTFLPGPIVAYEDQ